MYRFILVLLFSCCTSLIFSQASSVTHKFTNEFATGVQDEGVIRVPAVQSPNSPTYVGAPLYHTLSSTQTGTYNAYAYDNQAYYGYIQKFEKWITPNGPEIFNLQLSYTTYYGTVGSESSTSHVAKFLSEHNITIRSTIPFYGDHTEQVTLNYKGNNFTLNTSASTSIVDTKTLTVTFLNDFWYENIHFYNTKTNPMTLTTNANDPIAMALIMTHRGIPEWQAATRNLAASPTSSGPEAKVLLTWNEHPNQNVSKYEIWRICNTPQHPNETKKIGEVNRGTISFVDYDFYYYYGGATSVPTTVQYDVRAYYSIEGTYSPTDYISVPLYYHELSKKAELASELPTEYSIGNFPNPFNPTTTIKYQLPEAGFVTLKVYDILGREVAELVNENKAVGYYEVNFDASRLTSGVYIYTIQAGKYTESKKMILTK